MWGQAAQVAAQAQAEPAEGSPPQAEPAEAAAAQSVAATVPSPALASGAAATSPPVEALEQLARAAQLAGGVGRRAREVQAGASFQRRLSARVGHGQVRSGPSRKQFFVPIPGSRMAARKAAAAAAVPPPPPPPPPPSSAVAAAAAAPAPALRKASRSGKKVLKLGETFTAMKV